MSGAPRGARPTTRADPVAGVMPPPGFARAAWRMRHRLRAVLGMRRGFRAGEFYYKETGTELLWRAISRKGSGAKEYRVTFPDRSKQLIHCTQGREYADIMGPGLLAQYERAVALVRPGMRVLDIACGTGYGAAWLCGRVGSSGAVVAIDSDVESIMYAQKRYPTKNVAFEVGDERSLAGETDGSFDSVFSLRRLATGREEEAVLREMWRVTSPGGFLLVGRETSAEQEKVLSRVEFHAGLARSCAGAPGATEGIVEFMTVPGPGFQVALVRKPEA